MPAIPRFHAYPSRAALAEALAGIVAETLSTAIAKRGRATLVVSGGSTPKPFFDALRKHKLDWPSLLVTVADERWVPPDHPESNEKLVKERLLASKDARFVSLYNDASTPLSGEEAAEENIRRMALPFDVTVLGMGEDGHTAALFPRHPRLGDALESTQRLCMGIENAPKPPPGRMTLTHHALLQSRRLLLHVTGEGKREALKSAMQPGDATDLPIRAFLHQDEFPLEIHWAA